MSLKKRKVKDLYLYDTQIENIFINEYLPQAKGDYVRVYIYVSMYAGFGMETDSKTITEQLGITREKVKEAWDYWEKLELIKRTFSGDDTAEERIEFLNIKDMMYSTVGNEGAKAANNDKTVFDDENFRIMFDRIEKMMGRQLSSTEILKINEFVIDGGIPPETVFFTIEYCKQKGKDSFPYIGSVLKSWSDRGLVTVDHIREYLEENDRRHVQYRRVLKALGFNRNATEKEQELMDRWFDDYGYGMDKVLDAVAKTSGIASPNFNYVNKVLENWKKESEKRGIDDVNRQVNVSEGQLHEYYIYLQEKARKEAAERTEHIYRVIPQIREIDDRLTEVRKKLVHNMLNGKDGGSNKINEEKERLELERAGVLTDGNFDSDYTEVKYLCDKCRDTGITDMNEVCTCRLERLREAELWLKQRANEESTL